MAQAPRTISAIRPAIILALTFALLSLVAVASRAEGGEAPIEARTASALLLQLVLVAVGLALGGTALVVLGVWLMSLPRGPRRRKKSEDEIIFVREPPPLDRSVIALLLVPAALALGAAVVTLRQLARPATSSDFTSIAPSEPGLAPPAAVPASPPAALAPDLVGGLFIVGFALVFVGLIALVVRGMQSPGDLRSTPALASRPSAGDIDPAFLARGDPRQAVIAAWAWMERVLAAREVARQRSEAPTEYAERLGKKWPQLRQRWLALADRYERARFSIHPVDEAMRDAVIAAALDVRDRALER